MPSISTTSPEVLIELDRSKARGLRAQVEEELRDAIRSGRLSPGTALPSSRALATDLDVTRGVVVAAYDQLVAEGYLVSRHGSGTVVSATARGRRRAARRAPTGLLLMSTSVRAGPTSTCFPGRRGCGLRAPRYRRSRATTSATSTHAGCCRLRHALVDYLARVRGVSADPEQVVVCHGFGHGFSLVAQVLRDRRTRRDRGRGSRLRRSARSPRSDRCPPSRPSRSTTTGSSWTNSLARERASWS